jgi:DNA-binding NtrC family response regulator
MASLTPLRLPLAASDLDAVGFQQSMNKFDDLAAKLRLIEQVRAAHWQELEPKPVPEPPGTLASVVRYVETGLINMALEQMHGNVSAAARLLGTNRNNLYAKMLIRKITADPFK